MPEPEEDTDRTELQLPNGGGVLLRSARQALPPPAKETRRQPKRLPAGEVLEAT